MKAYWSTQITKVNLDEIQFHKLFYRAKKYSNEDDPYEMKRIINSAISVRIRNSHVENHLNFAHCFRVILMMPS